MGIRSLRRWWQIKTGKADTPFDGEVPFWIVSLGFHLLVIVLLAAVIMPPKEKPVVSLTIEETAVEVDEEDLPPPELQFDEMISEEIGADGDSGFETAAAQAPTIDMINEDTVDLEMEIRDVNELVTDDDFIEASAEDFSTIAVKGSVGQSVKAASGAIDRLTQEILLSMEEKNTVVVWLFDQSASLMEQREEILKRFDRIYKELGILEASGHESFKNGPPILTQVYAFGSRITPMLDDPTSDIDKIKAAVQEVERDRSGIENVMSAVIKASKDHESYRRIDRNTGEPKANVMIVVVSDEAGDDVDRVDEAIKICNKNQTPIYVIGVPAPFGRNETRVKWVDPDPEFDQTPQWAIVKQGPESVVPERLRLDFSGTFEDLDMIDSGFGPFHLTRLSYETGGIYFAVHPNRNTKRRIRRGETKSYSANLQYFFDPIAMRRYKPDYVSNKTYVQRLNENMARQALVEAAQYSTSGKLESPLLRFPKLNEANFVNLVTQAQRSAAIVEPALERLYLLLKKGEEDREQEISPRWQAGYDLAMGRTLAAKVRAQSYNSMLALAKTKLKFDKPKDKDTPQNNTWVLSPSNSTQTGSQDAKQLARAKKYLDRVVQQHPNTPWAMLAERELETPIGWKWSQDYTAPPRPRERRPNNNNNNNNNNPPRPMENAQPKTMRPPPKL